MSKNEIAKGDWVKITDLNKIFYDKQYVKDFEKNNCFKVIYDEDCGEYGIRLDHEDSSYDREEKCNVFMIGESYLKKVPPPKEDLMEKEMSESKEKLGTLRRLKKNSDLGDRRIAGRKIVKATRSVILTAAEQLAKNAAMDNLKIQAGLEMLKMLLSTDIGKGVLGTASGVAVAAMPFERFQKSETIQTMADELQIEGSSVIKEELGDMLLTYLAPQLTPILEGIAVQFESAAEKKQRIAPEKKRVSSSSKKETESEIEVEEETVSVETVAKQKQVA